MATSLMLHTKFELYFDFPKKNQDNGQSSVLQKINTVGLFASLRGPQQHCREMVIATVEFCQHRRCSFTPKMAQSRS
jgi:hypothetical protein